MCLNGWMFDLLMLGQQAVLPSFTSCMNLNLNLNVRTHLKASENDENPREKQMTRTSEIVKVPFNFELTGGGLIIFLSASFTHI